MCACMDVAKRSEGYLEVMDMERPTNDLNATAWTNFSPDEIYSVASLKESIRYKSL